MDRFFGMLLIYGIGLCLVSCKTTPLDDYVNRPDSHYSWFDTNITLTGQSTVSKIKWTGYVLNMTSQKWLTKAESSRPIWWHILVVIVPDNLASEHNDTAAVWITGGNNEGNPIPSADDEDILVASELAVGAQMVVASLFQIPNQHIVFPSDPTQKRRSEDAIIAFTWNHFIKHPDEPEWLLRLPMTKAVVRAFDTVTDFCAQKTGADVQQFIPAGASKRGWTTWTVAAVDKRVVMMIPIVMDELNFIKNIHHHYRAYGGWSFALEDYVEQNFTIHLDDPNTQLMADIVDPIAYAERYTMPKLICNSGGDEFFLPDDTHWWWSEMPEPKKFLMIPNAEHSMATGILELLPAAGAWALLNLHQQPVPEFKWIIDKNNGDITVTTATKPKHAYMWHSTTCNGERRDFRLINADNPCKCGISVKGDCVNLQVLWSKTELQPETTNTGVFTYKAHQDVVEDRWVAFFVDLVYSSPDGLQWPIDWNGDSEFTTEVSIVPIDRKSVV